MESDRINMAPGKSSDFHHAALILHYKQLRQCGAVRPTQQPGRLLVWLSLLPYAALDPPGEPFLRSAQRHEHDLLGERAVPADAYYGVHTLRALENFPITGTPISIYPDLIGALACVKQAAAIANSELGLLDEKRALAIRLACEEVREGRWHEEFV